MELYLEAGVEGCEVWRDVLHDVVPQLEQEGGVREEGWWGRGRGRVGVLFSTNRVQNNKTENGFLDPG